MHVVHFVVFVVKDMNRALLSIFWNLFLIFIIWYNILPVPLFQDPYATVLLDREGQVMGMKVADDGQMRYFCFGFRRPVFFSPSGGELVGFVPGISAEYTGRACGQWGKYAFDAGGAFGFGKSAPYRS